MTSSESVYSIQNNFSHVTEHLRYGDEVTPTPLEDGSFGVLLNSYFSRRHQDSLVDWIRVEPDSEYGITHITHVDPTPIAPRVNYLGTVSVGDYMPIGRDYQDIRSDVTSRHHVELRPNWLQGDVLGVNVIDTSTNGSCIWQQAVKRTQRETPKDDSYEESTGAEQPQAAAKTQNIHLSNAEGLKDTYQAAYKELEMIDYGIISNMIGAHKGELTKSDKKKILMLVHPDKNITGSPKRSHQLFLLAQELLDLNL